jgi:hypothetical protein
MFMRSLLTAKPDKWRRPPTHTQYNVMGVLMRKDSPLARKEAITPADLQGVPLLASSRRYNNFLPEFAAWLGTHVDRNHRFTLQYQGRIPASMTNRKAQVWRKNC